jgi:peptidoglycan/xylan/chitin deacetylase (PgdA/CDA1 family)
MKNNSGKILFSIDLEEFDIPEEYGQPLPLQTKLEVSLKGMESLEKLMEKHGVTSTIFSTAFWAQQYPDYVRHLSGKHEIASHTFYHDHFETEDLASSKTVLSAITGKDVVGIRMPLMQDIDAEQVYAAGYLYDSSLHPTWLPGRYNNLKSNRTLHKRNGLWILPASVTPVARIPVFWLAFKNIPFHIYTRMCDRILKKDGYMVFYFHPWEFTDLSGFKLPSIIKRKDGEALLHKLDKLFSYFSSKGYTFDSHQNFIKEKIAEAPALI